MLLRVPSYRLIVLHHYHHHHHHSPSSSAADLWIAKIISTIFLLYPTAASDHCLLSAALSNSAVSLAALRRLSDPSAAIRLFRSSPHSPLAFRYLIGLLCRSNLHHLALEVFDEMLDHPEPLDFFSFELLFHSCIDSCEADLAITFLARVSKTGYRARNLTFNKLLRLLVEKNRVDEAAVLFKECSSSRVFAPDSWSFNIMIGGFCRNGDVDAALGLLGEMDRFGLCPDLVTNNTVINGMCRAGQVDRAFEYLRRNVMDDSYVPDVVTCTSMISSCCKMGRMEDAFRLFDEMIDMGIKPSSVTFNVLIDGYGKAGNINLALSMYDRMLVNGCLPDVVTYTSLIDGYCRNEQLDEAMKLWDEMKERDIKPNVYSFSVVINSLCKKNRLKEARDLLKELNARGDITPRAFMYNPVIDGLCKAGNTDDANLVVLEMKDRGCFPDKITYTILIIGHCMKGKMSEAITLFHRMVASGCVPDNVVVGSLVSCLLKAGMPNEVNRVTNIASGKEFGVSPSSTKRQGISVAV